jgi:hypothetical protein
VSAVCIPSYNFLYYINIFIDLLKALKTKHDTPKYGLIYHAQLVGGASTRLKGKVSRMLAAKASLGCRYSQPIPHSRPVFRSGYTWILKSDPSGNLHKKFSFLLFKNISY